MTSELRSECPECPDSLDESMSILKKALKQFRHIFGIGIQAVDGSVSSGGSIHETNEDAYASLIRHYRHAPDAGAYLAVMGKDDVTTDKTIEAAVWHVSREGVRPMDPFAVVTDPRFGNDYSSYTVVHATTI